MSTVFAASIQDTVFAEAFAGLTADPKTLSAWLFYDDNGSRLFERITELPEYYLTRAERSIFAAYADEIIGYTVPDRKTLTIVELGAGTASKTGLLLKAAVQHQASILYQPLDVSEAALRTASADIFRNFPGVTVRYQVADYTREPLPLNHLPDTRTLALYIGSSIGNFTPSHARAVLSNLRTQLRSGDMLLLGTDLAPGRHKPVQRLVRAYNDGDGVTADFNRNVLVRLNRELGADFVVENFEHNAYWNPQESRIEMHLRSKSNHDVRIPGIPPLHFAEGETIHTENSYKFSEDGIAVLLSESSFSPTNTWNDPGRLFAVTLAVAV